MQTTLTKLSLKRMIGVHADLHEILDEAVKGDFPFYIQVSQGMRTPEEQAIFVAQGKSKTMDSRHLTGHAMDLVLLDQYFKVNWQEKNYFLLANYIRGISIKTSIPIRWGGCWRLLSNFNSAEDAYADYKAECIRLHAAGKRRTAVPFFDGPHFELPADQYPDQVKPKSSIWI